MPGSNEDVNEDVKIKKTIVSWLGHVEGMSDKRFWKKISERKESSNSRKGRLNLENPTKGTGRRREDTSEGMYEEVCTSFSLITPPGLQREAKKKKNILRRFNKFLQL